MLEVKIKADKYGQAIAMLLKSGDGFQTRYERTVIVNQQQQSALEQAGFVASNGVEHKRKPRAEKAK